MGVDASFPTDVGSFGTQTAWDSLIHAGTQTHRGPLPTLFDESEEPDGLSAVNTIGVGPSCLDVASGCALYFCDSIGVQAENLTLQTPRISRGLQASPILWGGPTSIDISTQTTEVEHDRGQQLHSSMEEELELCGRCLARLAKKRKERFLAASETADQCAVHTESSSSASADGSLDERTQANGDTTAQKSYKCNFTGCNQAFSSRRNLQRHKSIHSIVPLYSCSFCSASFFQKSSLNRHCRDTHKKESQVASGRRVRSRTERHSSVITESSEGKTPSMASEPSKGRDSSRGKAQPLYKCSSRGCGKRFISHELLVEHLQSHKQAKRFQCSAPECGLAFSSSSNLRRHQRIKGHDSTR